MQSKIYQKPESKVSEIDVNFTYSSGPYLGERRLEGDEDVVRDGELTRLPAL